MRTRALKSIPSPLRGDKLFTNFASVASSSAYLTGGRIVSRITSKLIRT